MNKKFNIDLKSKKTRKQILIAVTALIVVLTVLTSYYFSGTINDKPQLESQLSSTDETTEEIASSSSIYVDINGAVNEPSVIVLTEGSRVFEAIEAAGGLTEEANLTNINRAEILEDGTYLYIPTNREMEMQEVATASGNSENGALAGTQSKININTADSNTLQQLNGVGPSTAEKIIDYRTNTGKFKKVEDLKNVSGIGEKTFEKLSPHIKV